MKKTNAVKLGGNKPASDDAQNAAAEDTARQEAPAKPSTPPPPVEDHSDEPETRTAAPVRTAPAPREDESRALAPTSASPLARATGPAPEEDDGFNDLDDQIGFGSFPILILDKAEFVIGEVSLGGSVDVILQQSRKKHLYKEGGKDQSDYVVYSYDDPKNPDGTTKTYDQIHDTGGRPLSAVFAEWAEDGVDLDSIEHKQYSEAVALVISAGEFKGQLVLLSIPPASIKRFAGYRAELKTIRRCTLRQAITRLLPGNKVKVDKITFHPWNFKFVRKATDADLEVAFEEEGEE